MTSGQKAVAGVIGETADGLLFLKDFVESGKYRAVIDRTYPLAQMAVAHQ